MVDGDVLHVGEVPVRVLHTPGHRPEHCALLVGGTLLLTGDSLFVGDAARPDLAVGARRAPRASSTACGGSKSFRTTSPCTPVTSRARSAARR